MRLQVVYKQGGGFTVEAEEMEDVIDLLNTAQRVLWGKSAEAYSLEDMDKWLGWKK